MAWTRIASPGGVYLAAVARPEGPGPFPVVVILHGSHGYARQYVQLAKDLAQGGLLAVAPCWFAGGGGTGAGAVDAIPCPEAPPMTPPLSPEGQQAVETLVRAARALPDARPDRLALVGHSRGAGTALHYALHTRGVQAVVANSAGYPEAFAEAAARLDAPLLMLHGVADAPADGGSEFTRVERARSFEAAARRAGKRVEAFYYPEGRHSGLFTDPRQNRDAVRRITAFLSRRLR